MWLPYIQYSEYFLKSLEFLIIFNTYTKKKGKIVNYSDNKTSKILENVIKSADKNANIIAEFAIGTNPKAKIIGNILEDEKVLQTCHFAFGSNTTFGGNNQSNIHLDGIIDKPTIYLDSTKIIENGKLI